MKVVVELVIQEIGGDEGDWWRCRKLFYVVLLKTQNMCCRMNLCLSHVFFFKQVICFAGLYQSGMPQKRLCEQLGISLVSSEPGGADGSFVYHCVNKKTMRKGNFFRAGQCTALSSFRVGKMLFL